MCYTLAISCVKTSILLFYRRLSVSFTRSFLIAVWVGIAYSQSPQQLQFNLDRIGSLLRLIHPLSALLAWY